LAIDRIAHRDAVVAIPAGKCVEEFLRILIQELLLPRLAAVGRLIDPRTLAVADRENVGRIRIESLDVAEIEPFSARNGR